MGRAGVVLVVLVVLGLGGWREDYRNLAYDDRVTRALPLIYGNLYHEGGARNTDSPRKRPDTRRGMRERPAEGPLPLVEGPRVVGRARDSTSLPVITVILPQICSPRVLVKCDKLYLFGLCRTVAPESSTYISGHSTHRIDKYPHCPSHRGLPLPIL